MSVCVCQVKAVLNEGKKTYNVTYVPKVVGNHKVTAQPISTGRCWCFLVIELFLYVYRGTVLLVFPSVMGTFDCVP